METIRLDRQQQLAVIELHRPDCLNAISRQMLEELLCVLQQLRVEQDVQGVLLTGSGESFAAGADLQEVREFSPLEAIAFAELGQQVCTALEQIGKPILAAVSGYCLGAGLELALACDFMVAGETAQLGFKELSYGVLPAFGGTQRLPRLVGKAKAKELLFTGLPIPADEAYRIGLVNRLCPAAELRRQAVELLESICGHGLLSLRMAKEVIDAGYDVNLAAACKMERDAFAVCFSTEDQKEGMGAFIEKRAPKFKGQ